MANISREIRVDGNLAYVPLTQGYEAIIDAEDVALVSGKLWSAKVVRRRDGSVRTVYARAFVPGERGQRSLYMHTEILGVEGAMCDHRDCDGLNNRRENLRPATPRENMQNARMRRDNTSGVKGVCWHKARAKWRAKIKVDGKTVSLGYFHSKDDAGAAYIAASLRFHGDFARLQ